MRTGILCVLVLTLSTIYAEEAQRPKAHEDKLAGEEHYEEGTHNPDYDHESFLGEDKEEYDNLQPEEARKRLKVLIKNVDADKDGAITTEELTAWVQKVFKDRTLHGAEKDVEDKDTNKNGLVDWNEYVKGTYGETADDDEEVKELWSEISDALMLQTRTKTGHSVKKNLLHFCILNRPQKWEMYTLQKPSKILTVIKMVLSA